MAIGRYAGKRNDSLSIHREACMSKSVNVKHFEYPKFLISKIAHAKKYRYFDFPIFNLFYVLTSVLTQSTEICVCVHWICWLFSAIPPSPSECPSIRLRHKLERQRERVIYPELPSIIIMIINANFIANSNCFYPIQVFMHKFNIYYIRFDEHILWIFECISGLHFTLRALVLLLYDTNHSRQKFLVTNRASERARGV